MMQLHQQSLLALFLFLFRRPEPSPTAQAVQARRQHGPGSAGPARRDALGGLQPSHVATDGVACTLKSLKFGSEQAPLENSRWNNELGE